MRLLFFFVVTVIVAAIVPLAWFRFQSIPKTKVKMAAKHMNMAAVNTPPPAKYMKYVLQWPPTFCIQLPHKQPGASCIKTIPQQLFLHGVWPADKDGKSITNTRDSCGTRDPADWNTVFTSQVKSELDKFWPSVVAGTTAMDLWKHEWREHGVCAGATYTATDYFATAIKINKVYKDKNPYFYFRTSKVIACEDLYFTKAEIVKAVQKGVGSSHDIYVTCLKYNTTHGYLDEISLCTTLNGGKFENCPSKEAPTSCDTYAHIMLPQPPP